MLTDTSSLGQAADAAASRPNCLALIRRTLAMAGLAAAMLDPVAAAESPSPEVPKLETVVVVSPRVANQEPAGALNAPISALSYEPGVDVQARNVAEGQADVSIRGGIFENTGFKLGAVSLYDPQTGHYLAEVPVAPDMLAAPVILTGVQNAQAGFNANVGTVAWGWRPVETRGRLTVGAGDHGFRQASFYQGAVAAAGSGKVGADAEWARSEGDGTRPGGDHDFERIAGRVQVQMGAGQTDFFAGYEHKFFAWPNLYTPFGFDETENLQTFLVSLNHRTTYGDANWIEAGAYYRRNKDDYEFNRAVPGASNPFQHTTHVRGAAIEGYHGVGAAGVRYQAAWMRDHLDSTALTFGRFRDRDSMRASVAPLYVISSGAGDVTLEAGATYDDTNRDGSAVSPMASVAYAPHGSAARLHLEYSETSQVASYTALNSSPSSGLFRGNPDLGREYARNLELGGTMERSGWTLEGAVFQRWEDDLVDWTFKRGVVARTANPVDMGVTGFELFAMRHRDSLDLAFGYTFLDKDADYGTAAVDASFYALNYARHRLTAAVTWRIGAGWEVRSDNEFRVQADNLLRATGGDEALLSDLAALYTPPSLSSVELAVHVANVWNSNFEEVPSVPAARRQISAQVAWRW